MSVPLTKKYGKKINATNKLIEKRLERLNVKNVSKVVYVNLLRIIHPVLCYLEVDPNLVTIVDGNVIYFCLDMSSLKLSPVSVRRVPDKLQEMDMQILNLLYDSHSDSKYEKGIEDAFEVDAKRLGKNFNGILANADLLRRTQLYYDISEMLTSLYVDERVTAYLKEGQWPKLKQRRDVLPLVVIDTEKDVCKVYRSLGSDVSSYRSDMKSITWDLFIYDYDKYLVDSNKIVKYCMNMFSIELSNKNSRFAVTF